MSSSKYLRKLRTVCWILLLSILYSNCGQSSSPDEVRKLVYEGMSSAELRISMGEPLQIDSTGKVYDVRENKNVRIERWEYELRTVVLINDTVKSANEKIN